MASNEEQECANSHLYFEHDNTLELNLASGHSKEQDDE